MSWKVEYAESVQKSVGKQSRQTQERLRAYLEIRLARMQNPRQLGLAIRGTRYRNLWRYRVGDYRIIAEIDDKRIRILVVRIAHRREAYRSRLHLKM